MSIWTGRLNRPQQSLHSWWQYPAEASPVRQHVTSRFARKLLRILTRCAEEPRRRENMLGMVSVDAPCPAVTQRCGDGCAGMVWLEWTNGRGMAVVGRL